MLMRIELGLAMEASLVWWVVESGIRGRMFELKKQYSINMTICQGDWLSRPKRHIKINPARAFAVQ